MPEQPDAVIISGANGGIGRALLESFRDAGFYTIALDVTAKACDCDFFIRCDFEVLARNEEERSALAELLFEALKNRSLKTLVNNAATQKLASLEDLSLYDFQSSLDVNVTASLILIQLLQQQLAENYGSVINVGSIHSRLTKPKFISYATSKAALLGLTQALAVDCGERIRFNIVEPAATKTEMLMDGFADIPGAFEALESFHPMNRIADPSEIAAMVLFLASDKCRFANGASISIDGGIAHRLHDPD